jgi:hypothetical protein
MERTTYQRVQALDAGARALGYQIEDATAGYARCIERWNEDPDQMAWGSMPLADHMKSQGVWINVLNEDRRTLKLMADQINGDD